MGIYLCLNDTTIHNADLSQAVNYSDINSLSDIHDNEIDLVYFCCSSHKIKKKAEQLACQLAINMINKQNE
jgi:hypothetical protein